MEKTLGRGHGEQRADFAASAGLAENRDVIGIAAELGDVPIHPAKGMHDVEHAYFARGSEIRAAQLRQIEEAEGVQPVINGHYNHVAAAAEIGSIFAGTRSRAVLKMSAVAPEHHGALAPIVEGGRPDVQHQAIFAL